MYKLCDKVITLVVFLCEMNQIEMKYHIQYVLIGVAILLIVIACKEDSNGARALSTVNPSIQAEFIRAEQLLQEGDLASLKNESPDFYNLYFRDILGVMDTSEIAAVNQGITQDTGYMKLYEEVQINYADLGQVRNEVNQALENYIEAFGLTEAQLPNVYTFISGFIYQAFVFQDGPREGVGVGLDMFLGRDFSYKDAMPKDPLFSDYLTRSYNADHLAKKVIEVLVEDKLAPPSKGDFLSLIIWGGKKLYVMDQILTFTSDTVVTEYTRQQLEWCNTNQVEMWDYFFDRDLFYSTDYRSFNKLISPAPTSPGMPPESPGATGNFMGWQIIKSYMRRHPEKTITNLVGMQDAQEILDESKYKPS